MSEKAQVGITVEIPGGAATVRIFREPGEPLDEFFRRAKDEVEQIERGARPFVDE